MTMLTTEEREPCAICTDMEALMKEPRTSERTRSYVRADLQAHRNAAHPMQTAMDAALEKRQGLLDLEVAP